MKTDIQRLNIDVQRLYDELESLWLKYDKRLSDLSDAIGRCKTVKEIEYFLREELAKLD